MSPRPVRPFHDLARIQAYLDEHGSASDMARDAVRDAAAHFGFDVETIIECVLALDRRPLPAGGNFHKQVFYPPVKNKPRDPDDVYFVDFDGCKIYLKLRLVRNEKGYVASFHQRD